MKQACISNARQPICRGAMILLVVIACQGCASSRPASQPPWTSPAAEAAISARPTIGQPAAQQPARSPFAIALAAHQQTSQPDPPPATQPRPPADQARSGPNPIVPEEVPAGPPSHETLEDLEAFAAMNSPVLRRLQEQASAAWARTGYVDALPDPTLRAMFFGDAMMLVPDRQLAEVEIMQMFPWLGRLKAEARRAYFEALAAENLYAAERLRLIADVRATWFQLYVLRKQIEIAEADKAQVQSLIDTANARVTTGDAQPGDVLLATLEFTNLEEQLLGYRQRVVGLGAELNRLVGRDPRVPIAPPSRIDAQLPAWSHDLLREVAFQYQPELIAARLETEAKRWGIEVARLRRRPDLSLGAGWMPMAADPADTMPGAGNDSWTLGFQVNVPLWHGKYNAMEAEASREHLAAHAEADEVALRIDATLRDLWEQAVAANKTVRLYETTILPQARQTLEADLQSLANNTVTFDRVVRNYRTLLNLELGYHRALGQLATTLARIRQTAGVDLSPASLP